jgi:DNA repair protein RadD
MFALRPYQSQALTALETYWRAGGGNPLVSMATATFKSLVIAWLIRDLLQRYPSLRVLVLVHVQELVGQNVEHLIKLWPDAPIGINCAALGRRDCHHQILFASIQSVFRNPEAIGRRDLVIVDESHLVPHRDDGMYRTLLDALHAIEPGMRVCGLTATPFRLDSGRLDEGDGKIFNDIVYNYGIGEGVEDGWLSPLTSKSTATRIDVENVSRRGGEFIESELQDAADVEAVVNGACDEITKLGADRQCWLVFCARRAVWLGYAPLRGSLSAKGPVIWLCKNNDCHQAARNIYVMTASRLDAIEQAAAFEAGATAAGYLEGCGTTDLAKLRDDEWREFLRRLFTGFEHVLRQKIIEASQQ